MNERLQIELYQLFRDYSGIEIGYNDFVEWLDSQIETLKTIEIEEVMYAPRNEGNNFDQ